MFHSILRVSMIHTYLHSKVMRLNMKTSSDGLLQVHHNSKQRLETFLKQSGLTQTSYFAIALVSTLQSWRGSMRNL